MNRNMSRARKALDKAQEDFLQCFLDEVEKVAKKNGLQEVFFTGYSNQFTLKNGRVVENYKPIDDLEHAYLRVDKYGVQARWLPEKGWAM